MTPEQRLYQLAWPAFKRLAVRTLGRRGAAKLLRTAAEVLEAEQAVADKQASSHATNVVPIR